MWCMSATFDHCFFGHRHSPTSSPHCWEKNPLPAFDWTKNLREGTVIASLGCFLVARPLEITLCSGLNARPHSDDHLEDFQHKQ